jgi:restriction system protein
MKSSILGPKMIFLVVTLSTAAVSYFFIYIAPTGSDTVGSVLGWLLILSPVIGILAASVAESKKMPARRDAAIEHLRSAVELHRGALSKNLSTAKKTNDYGLVIADHTYGVLAEFLNSIGLDMVALPDNQARSMIIAQMETYAEEDRVRGFDPWMIPKDGLEFEYWVAEGLRRFGWDATVTSGSGDQGIDVICTRDGFRLGLQCKLYSGTIGNKAVQEANAGKVFYKLDQAGVITNSTFTRSAKELAQSAGIHLFSHHDIPTMHQRICGNEAVAPAGLLSTRHFPLAAQGDT